MNTLEEAKEYFTGRCKELILMSTAGDPWVFVCASAMIDYLTQMTTGNSGRQAYIAFVKDFLGEINPKYSSFQYANGMQDLPTQMYIILRCGIVHKFSFVPGKQESNNGGRKRSIVLAHEKNGHKGAHLAAHTNNEMNAAIFTAEQFVKDIKAVVELIFIKGKADFAIKNNILAYISSYPPILGKFN